MPRKVRALETVGLKAIRLRPVSGTESRSSSRERCRSWRLAWRCSAAVGSVAAATVPGAARIDRHIHRFTAEHHQGSCSPPVVGCTHRATRVRLHHTHTSGRFATTIANMQAFATLCRPSQRAPSRAPNLLRNLLTGRTGHQPSRSHMTTTTVARSLTISQCFYGFRSQPGRSATSNKYYYK